MRLPLLVLFLLTGFSSPAQQLYFPPVTGNAWDTLSPQSQGYRADRIDSLYAYLQATNSKAFILLKDGKIVLEKYFGSFSQDSGHVWNSAGKSLTAFAIGMAQQEGYLSINDTTSNRIGNGWTTAPLAKERKITIRHQLTMTSGLNDAGDNNCTDPACLTYLADAGTRWAYHTGVYTLLDSVIERATGQNINRYLLPRLRTTTGITGLYVKLGYNNIFYSKPRSLARYGNLILGKGTWNGTPLLTDTAYYRQMIHPSQSLNLAYGYLWWLNGQSSYRIPQTQIVFPGMIAPNAPADMVCALGKDGQILSLVPSQNLHWIRMGDNPGGATLLVSTEYADRIWAYLNLLQQPTDVRSTTQQGEVYPNPASDLLHLSGPGPFSGVLANACGQTVRHVSASVVDLKGLPTGVYTLQLSGRAPQRVLVQH